MDPSILFVIALVILAVAGLVGGAFQNWFVVGVAFIAASVATWLYAGPAILSYVASNWLQLLGGASIYLVLGILYALYRWWAHVSSDKVQADIKMGLKQWREADIGRPFKESVFYPTTIRPKRHEILTWLIWWPISFVFYFFGDLMRDFFHGLYRRIAAIFTAISDRAVRRAGGD